MTNDTNLLFKKNLTAEAGMSSEGVAPDTKVPYGVCGPLGNLIGVPATSSRSGGNQSIGVYVSAPNPMLEKAGYARNRLRPEKRASLPREPYAKRRYKLDEDVAQAISEKVDEDRDLKSRTLQKAYYDLAMQYIATGEHRITPRYRAKIKRATPNKYKCICGSHILAHECKRGVTHRQQLVEGVVKAISEEDVSTPYTVVNSPKMSRQNAQRCFDEDLFPDDDNEGMLSFASLTDALILESAAYHKENGDIDTQNKFSVLVDESDATDEALCDEVIVNEMTSSTVDSILGENMLGGAPVDNSDVERTFEEQLDELRCFNLSGMLEHVQAGGKAKRFGIDNAPLNDESMPGVHVEDFGLSSLMNKFTPTAAAIDVLELADIARVTAESAAEALALVPKKESSCGVEGLQSITVPDKYIQNNGSYYCELPTVKSVGLGNMMGRLMMPAISAGTEETVSQTTEKTGKNRVTRTSGHVVIERKARWYNRLLFNKKPSKFDFSVPINREIGQLTARKDQSKLRAVTIPDDCMIPELFNYLKLNKFPQYDDRKICLEHMHKLSRKWLDEKTASLDSYPTDFVHKISATVQKATDEIDTTFLLARDTIEYDRRVRVSLWRKMFSRANIPLN